MEPLASSEKVLICLTCGDKGFTNAFVYCASCLGFVVHRYCLDVMPKTFDEFVPWFCEDCRPAVPNQIALAKARKTSQSQKKVAQTHSMKKQKKERDIASLITGTEEVNRQDDTRDYVLKEASKKSNSSQRQGLVAGKELIEHEKPGTAVSPSSDFTNVVQHDHYLLARPVIDPVWRGSFEIPNTYSNLFEGFVAHLSNKACDKVCQEANALPSLLCLEMHPKTVLWPKSFQDCHPSDENIALYFFPGDAKNEKAFDHLVIDMMDEGLAMRATAKNAELLIFTSKVLPRSYWRFQGKYYLWGVFRGKRNESRNHKVTASNNSGEHGQSKGSRNEIAVHGKKTVTRVKTLDARSPQSPLSNTGESGLDMDLESGD